MRSAARFTRGMGHTALAMAEEENPEQRQGEPTRVGDPERQRQMMYHLYLHASGEGRILMAPLFEQLGLPLPFTVAQPPEPVTLKMVSLALEQLLRQSAMLGRENARVSLGVSQLDPELGAQMITGYFLAFKEYQGLLGQIIEKLKGKDEEQLSS